MENVAKRTYKKKKLWSEDAMNILFGVWREKYLQLRGNRRNAHIYEAMAAELQKEDYDFNVDEVRVKINNLMTKYRQERLAVDNSNGEPSDWPLYQTVHDIVEQLNITKIEQLEEESLKLEDFEEVWSQSPPPASPAPVSPMASRSSSPAQAPAVTMASLPPLPPAHLAPKKRKYALSDNETLIFEFQKLTTTIESHLEHSRKMDMRMLAIAEQKKDLLEKLINKNVEMMDNVMEFLYRQS